MFEKEIEALRSIGEQNNYQALELRKKIDQLIQALDRLTAALSKVEGD